MKLSKGTLTLWGKKTSRNGVRLWLPLVAHMVDTLNVGYWLYENWISEGDRELLIKRRISELVDAGVAPEKARRQAETEIEKAIKFLCYSHDIGKATPPFQLKKSYCHDDQLDKELVDRLMNNSFAGLSTALLPEPDATPHAKAGEAILEREGLNETLGSIIGGHHGKPQECSQYNLPDIYTANFYQSEGGEAKKHWEKAQKELIEYGLELAGFTDVNDTQHIKDLLPVTQPEAVILEGLVIMADWLASSEYLNDDEKSPMFTLIGLNQGYEDLDMAKRCADAIAQWKKNDPWKPEEVKDAEHYYEKHFGFKPRQVQKVMADNISEAEDPGLIIVEAPMGIGKTEISFTAAEQLATVTGRNGVYIGLPTQATSNAMFKRFIDWLDIAAKKDGQDYPVELLHGKAAFNYDFSRLPRAEDIDGDDAQEGTVVVNSWFSGKKSILADFEVGTVDNLLLMGLKQKHLFLRHLGFSSKVIVLDEVHAYDTYMSSYLYKALKWLGAYHVPVVILSATLPKDKRNEIIDSYFLGKYNEKTSKDLIAPIDWKNNASYPLLTVLDGKELKQFSDFGPKQASHTLKIEYMDESPTEIMAKVEERIRNGGVAGIIVNTVRRAQEIADLVPKDIKYLVLHSSFLTRDRSKHEAKLEHQIGKHSKRPDKYIVIGTQVLEQSLDIDFDVLFTDIAPMDLLLQRAGRLHRHEIDRPKGLESRLMYVLKPENGYGNANEAIYEKYYLQKTEAFLPNVITLPDDISTLVQKVYDPSADALVDNIESAREKRDDDYACAKSKAESFQVCDPKYPKKLADLQNNRLLRGRKRNLTIHGWLDWNKDDLDDNQAEAAVRDIRESVEVVLLKKVGGEYFLLDNTSIADVSDKKLAMEVIRLPELLTRNTETVIKYLTTSTKEQFPEWQNSSWLKGALALVLDENNQTVFNGYQLEYSSKVGLRYSAE